jgi:flagellar biosynthetic protein FliP
MTTTPNATTAPSGGAHVASHFWRHFAGMFAVMVVGMIASAAVFLTIVQMTWDEATRQRPAASLLVIATGMSVPMAAWMLYRGMGRKNTAEMAAAMVLPVIPFLGLVWFGVTDSALCGPYCISAIVAMLALMLHRHSEYA